MTTITFTEPDGSAANVVAEAELHFNSGPLAGLKLVGFTVRRDPKTRALYVTLPAKAFGVGPERRYFDFLRASSGENHKAVTRDVRAWILDAYRAHEALPKEAK